MEIKDKKEVVPSNFGYNERVAGFIKTIVAEFMKMPISAYNDRSRKRDVVNLKHFAIWFCMKNIRGTKVEIGSYFGISHCMIIYVCSKVDGFLTWDVDMKKMFYEIQDVIDKKGLSEAKGVDLEKDFYYIDLGEVTSVKYEDGKSMILKGFSDSEVEKIHEWVLLERKSTRKHIKTGLYILENLTPKTEENEPN